MCSNKNLGYSAMNTACSAVSSVLVIDGRPAGQHPLLRCYMKGVIHQKPALPRYATTWDISIALSYLKKTLSPVRDLSLEMLSQKLLMLSLIWSGQQALTIHLFDVRNMLLSYSRVTFTIGNVHWAWQTYPGFHTLCLCAGQTTMPGHCSKALSWANIRYKRQNYPAIPHHQETAQGCVTGHPAEVGQKCSGCGQSRSWHFQAPLCQGDLHQLCCNFKTIPRGHYESWKLVPGACFTEDISHGIQILWKFNFALT